MPREIYLDNAATTPVAPEVLQAMLPHFSDNFHNAATKYSGGRNAALAVKRAREQVAKLINAEPEEIYFTSGGTESNNWVIQNSITQDGCSHIISTAIEHHAVLHVLDYLKKRYECDNTILPVNSYGMINIDEMVGAIRKKIPSSTMLASIMWANNEIGTIQCMKEIGKKLNERVVYFHTDAVQAVGKIPVDVKACGVDYLSLSAHKFHGPKGVGALFIRKGLAEDLGAFILGGAQERTMRAGTTNVAGVVGLGKAAELAMEHMQDSVIRQKHLKEKLWNAIFTKISDVKLNGHPEYSVPSVLNVCFAGIECESLLASLNAEGICVACGSACTSESVEPSHVLKAIGRSPKDTYGSVRFSFSRMTTEEEIDTVINVLPEMVEKVRSTNLL
jgi:cysteine desulfurase